ncbi:NUDIX hydrolase [Plantactinospora siamensis]|uniref:NUDIX hydrolase n=1 Tax=Plantactinospora siamensis TaxID=555372 RepID=A0ABV6NYH3_9ACTN
MGEQDWPGRFPRLFTEAHVGYADCRVRFTTEPVPAELVSRMHVVPVTADGRMLVCRSAQGWRFLPGGTREPGESVPQLVARELREEAGARLLDGPRYLGAFVADSARPGPFRPHLPHPRSYWAYGVARVCRDGPPVNPPDGERVVEVLALRPQEAAAYLDGHDPVDGDVVRLAAAMGLLAGDG